MSRFGGYTQKDTPWALDGDNGWKGIDMLHEPSTVPPGYLSRSENKRLLDGRSRKRPGTTYPADYNSIFENYIIGSAIYSGPNNTETMLVATAGATYVWSLQFGKDPQKIMLNASEISMGRTTGFYGVEFVQAFEKVLLLRRPFVTGQHTLVWDGVIGGTPASTFDPVTLSDEGLNLIPDTWNGEAFQDRVLLYTALYNAPNIRDTLYMTDVNDVTSFDKALGTFRINSGESDTITRVLGYYKGAAIILMVNSIHMLENFTVDPFQASQRLISARLGSVGNKMPLLVGQELYFASNPGGIYGLLEIQTESITAEPLPLSLPIDPIIKRINWPYAHLYGCSNKLGPYGFFAFPIDGAVGGNNAILVLNTTNREWESAPDWWANEDFRINALHVTDYNGQRALFGLDYAASKIYVLYQGIEDEINGDSVPVHDLMETRGYVNGDPSGFKRYQRTIIGVSTYDPDAKVTAISDGFNEEKELGTITKDRLRFYVHGHPRFDVAKDDPTEPKRQDYSTTDTNSAIEDFEQLPVGPLPFIPPTPLVFNGVMQQSLERFRIRQNGRWCKIRIEDTGGICDVTGVGVEAIPAQESLKVVA
jgi:hypothetical protein